MLDSDSKIKSHCESNREEAAVCNLIVLGFSQLRNRPNQNFTKFKLRKNYFADTHEILENSTSLARRRHFLMSVVSHLYRMLNALRPHINFDLFVSFTLKGPPINFSNGPCTVLRWFVYEFLVYIDRHIND